MPWKRNYVKPPTAVRTTLFQGTASLNPKALAGLGAGYVAETTIDPNACQVKNQKGFLIVYDALAIFILDKLNVILDKLNVLASDLKKKTRTKGTGMDIHVCQFVPTLNSNEFNLNFNEFNEEHFELEFSSYQSNQRSVITLPNG